MARVICAAVDCKYLNDEYVCTAKKIILSDHDVVTQWQGMKRFQRCKMWEESEFAKTVRVFMGEKMGKGSK